MKKKDSCVHDYIFLCTSAVYTHIKISLIFSVSQSMSLAMNWRTYFVCIWKCIGNLSSAFRTRSRYIDMYLHLVKCWSFWFCSHDYMNAVGNRGFGARKPGNSTGRVAVVSQTDRPKVICSRWRIVSWHFLLSFVWIILDIGALS